MKPMTMTSPDLSGRIAEARDVYVTRVATKDPGENWRPVKVTRTYALDLVRRRSCMVARVTDDAAFLYPDLPVHCAPGDVQ